MTHLVLVIDIDGDVDQAGLERLRTHLNLKKQGRLSDDWDEEFGYRIVEEASGQRINIGLFRISNESWKISVLTTSQPDPGSRRSDFTSKRVGRRCCRGRVSGDSEGRAHIWLEALIMWGWCRSPHGMNTLRHSTIRSAESKS